MPSWLIDRQEGEARARAIEWLVLDVDGVLTDGMLYTGPDGTELQAFHVHDGHGIRLWQRAGRHAAIISGRTSVAVERRSADLGIARVYQGAKVKTEVFSSFLAEAGTTAASVCYVGDEVLDIPLFRCAGLAVAVSDAVPEAIDAAHLVTLRRGGRGAVRETVDFLLKLQGLWPAATMRYFGGNEPRSNQ